MKSKLFFLMAFACLIAIALPSCKKYVDGPKFSLLSKKARVCNDWKVEFYSYNDVDGTSAFLALAGDYKISIERNGDYTISGNFADAGTWELGEDGDDIMFTSKTAGVNMVSCRILRLKNKELWWRKVESNGDLIKMHMVPAK